MNESNAYSSLAAYPEIAALVVLVLGIVLARLARGGVAYLLNKIDQRMARYTTSDSGIVSPEFVGFSKGLAFWVVVLGSVIAALHLLGIDGLSDAIGATFTFIPRLITGFAIVGAGHLLGLLLRNLAARMSDATEPDSLGPRLVHGAVLLVAIVMGLQQMNIDITFITQLVLVLVVVIMGGMALAFALGARQYTANLVAHSELQRYALGERIRIGAHEGTIVNIHRTGVDLATGDGIVSVPAAHFSREAVVRLPGEAEDE